MRIACFILLAGFAFAFHNTNAQGCSDAGFCSINGVKPEYNTGDSVKLRHTIKTGLSLGSTRYNVGILSPNINYAYNLTDNLSFSMKLSAQYRWGELTNTAGFSDILLSVNYRLSKSFGLIFGGKIPLNMANNKYKSFSMPMAYQTGLGTFDAILGMQYFYNNFIVTTAWQQPLIQNENTYKIGTFNEKKLGAAYLETNGYERAGDVLLRISYQHQPQGSLKKFSFVYSILPIYHLKNDLFRNSNNEMVDIENSKGLTFNINLFARYALSSNSAFELSTGFPVISRQVRPDGMSQFAMTLEYSKQF